MVETRQKWEAWKSGKLAAGLCSRCGKRPVIPGKDYCATCAQASRLRRVELYHSRLRKGLCPQCGGKREDPGVIGCDSCNQVKHLKGAEKLEQKCRRCGGKLILIKWNVASDVLCCDNSNCQELRRPQGTILVRKRPPPPPKSTSLTYRRVYIKAY